MTRKVRIEPLEQRQLLAADWMNAWRPLDVNADGDISPVDALVGINRLNFSAGELPVRSDGSTEPFYDTNGDSFHTPVDILIVIQGLNISLGASIELSEDTGVGSGGQSDKLTRNPSVRGTISGGADQLLARFPTGPWLDVSHTLDASGDFLLDEETIEQLAEGQLSDGSQRIELEYSLGGSSSSLRDRSSFEFELDRSAPNANVIGDILITEPGVIEIPFNEPLSSESADAIEVTAYDITWGENEELSWIAIPNYPRFPLQVRSVDVSADNRRLIVRLPIENRSTKVLLELGAVIEDAAGNRFEGDAGSATWSVRANQFEKRIPLHFGNTILNRLQFEPRISEYRFLLESPDTLLWTGDVTLGTLARYELYDANGVLRHEFLPNGSPTTISEAQKPALLPLPAGEYFLRVVEPPASQSFFRIHRTSELAELPNGRSNGNPDRWPFDAYYIDLEADETLYLEAREDEAVLHKLFDLQGNEVFPRQHGVSQSITATNAGRFILLTNRVGHRVHRSIPDSLEFLDTSVPAQGRLEAPGQKTKLSIAVEPFELYHLEIKLDDGIWRHIDFSQGVFREIDDSWLVQSDSERLEIDLERVDDVPNAGNYEIRLTKLRDAPDLPIGTPIDPPSAGEYQWFRISYEERFGLDDSRPYHFVSAGSNGVSAQTFYRPTTITKSEGQQSRYVGVAGKWNDTPWQVILPTRFEGPLDLENPNPVTYETGLEQFEFSFLGEAGEMLHAHFNVVQDMLSFRAARLPMQLAAPSGKLVPYFLGSESPNFWHLDESGEYRLRFEFTSIGNRGLGELHAEISSNWPELSHGAATVEPAVRRIYRLPANSDVSSLIPGRAGRPVPTWRVFDQAGNTLAVSPFNSLDDLWLKLPAPNQYFLEVDNQSFFDAFDFRFENSGVSTSEIELGETFHGSIEERGDRIRLDLNLQRGQRVRWEGIPFGDSGPLRAFLLGPNQEVISLRANNREPFPTHWLPTDSGTYTLEIRSASDLPQQFSLLVSDAPTPALGAGTSGFDVVYEGTLERSEENQGRIEFPFSAEEGAVFMLDWQEGVASGFFTATIRDAGGLEIWFSGGGIEDSDLLIAPATGDYTLGLELRSHFNSAKYKMALRDLSSGPSLNLGETIEDVILKPYETKLFRLQPHTIRDVDFISSVNKVVRVSVLEVYPGTSAPLGRTAWPKTLTADAQAVVVSSFIDETAITLTTSTQEHLQPLALDKPNFVTVNPGLNAFGLSIELANSRFTLDSTGTDVEFIVRDQSGNRIVADENGEYFAAEKGAYRIEASTPAESLRQSVVINVGLIDAPGTLYTPGEIEIHTDLVPGELFRYSFQIIESGPYLFRIPGGEDVQLVDILGANVQLRKLEANQFHGEEINPIQLLDAGSYEVSFRASGEVVNFQVTALGGVPEIILGESSGILQSGELERVLRHDMQAGESVVFGGEAYRSRPYFIEGADTLSDALGNVQIVATDAQTLLVFAGQTRESRDYEFSLVPTPESRVVSLANGQVVSGQLDPFQSLAVNFTLESQQTVLFEPQSADYQLTLPSGKTYGRPSSHYASPWFDLPAGTYTVTTPAHRFLLEHTREFSTSLLSFDSANLLSIPFNDLISVGELRRFEVAEASEYYLSGQIRLWDETQSISIINGRAFLQQGSYWIRPFGLGDIPVEIERVSRTLVNATFDEEISVEASDKNDGFIRYELSSGDLVDWRYLSIPDNVSAQYRIIQRDTHISADEHWLELGDWTGPRLIKLDSVLEVSISGTGLSEFSLMSLNQAPLIELDRLEDLVLPARTEQSIWRLPADVNDAYVFSKLQASTDVSWQLLDSLGNTIASVSEELLFSVGSDQNFYLRLLSHEPEDVISVRIELSRL